MLTRSGALPADALSVLDDDAETSADAIVSYAEQLADLYPRHGDFVALRDRLDPERVLTNDYLDRVLGP